MWERTNKKLAVFYDFLMLKRYYVTITLKDGVNDENALCFGDGTSFWRLLYT